MNIWNDEERKVVCIRNEDDPMMVRGETAPLLTVGAKYTVTRVYVGGWYTIVTLAEFPNKEFNSVLFRELNEEDEEDD